MKLSLSFSLIATIASSTGFLLFAHAAPQLAGPNAIPIGDYIVLNDACIAGGDDSYVGVRYSDGSITTFDFDECYPYQLPNGALAQQAVFCKSATCYNNPYPDCSGGVVPPVPVPVVAGLTLPNAGDWVQFLGQGARCERNTLSGLGV